MANKISLSNGCSYSEPTVFPANWKTAKASTAVTWYVKCRFYQKGFPPYQIQRKCGNDLNTAEGRRGVVRDTLAHLKHYLEELEWNPRTGRVAGEEVAEATAPIKKVGGVNKDSSLRRALGFAILKKRDGGMTPETVVDVRGYCRRLIPILQKNHGAAVTISAVRRPHLFEALEELARVRKWGSPSYNNCRAYLHALWEVLILHEVVDYNPVHGIKGRPKATQQRKVLSEKERALVLATLPAHPYFENAVHIFYSSGGREIELCYVQGKDVDLKERTFYVTVRKGAAGLKKVCKAITEAALPYWERQMKGCKPEDYVFSDHFMPGPRFWLSDRFGRWWKRIIKIPLGIEADFYALKHLHTTQVAAVSAEMAKDFNSHSSTKMNEMHYDVMSDERKLEARKKSNVKL